METNQHELYENARKRIVQKKRLFYHFVIFLIGSIFIIVINKGLHVGEQTMENWFVWAILAWAFLFTFHFVNVFIIKGFMNKDWERQQIDRLVQKQEQKIQHLQSQVEEDFAKKNTL
ncbi:2TM domain-containing protein [Flavobacterium kingsejongi]|uniref:2TM domain-containing protein n=1 Tax=Flavobacterium kingsejongi TaxID=1678728 RepID=A0A2S1LN12_9FLAO|nr:2TM domain-containing protein [Flavobacterium kingsejongi]AWG25143.1 hypothetical protein FK004_07800 [Flavobacterium kingsejongi]